MIIFEGHHKFGHDHFRTEIWDIDDLGRDVGGRQVIHFPEQLERPSGHEMWQWKNNYTALLFCNYQWIFPLKMVIFYSYVSLPEGKYGDYPYDQEIECSHVLTQRKINGNSRIQYMEIR